MNEEELQAMQGQIAALSMALAAVMQTLPAAAAAQAALQLSKDQEQKQLLDDENETPQAQASARWDLAERYGELLRSRR